MNVKKLISKHSHCEYLLNGKIIKIGELSNKQLQIAKLKLESNRNISNENKLKLESINFIISYRKAYHKAYLISNWIDKNYTYRKKS